jgi:predicted transcriptional regulator
MPRRSRRDRDAEESPLVWFERIYSGNAQLRDLESAPPSVLIALTVTLRRISLAKSQGELAREMLVDQPRIAEIEAALNEPQLATIAKLAKALRCRPKDLQDVDYLGDLIDECRNNPRIESAVQDKINRQSPVLTSGHAIGVVSKKSKKGGRRKTA